MAQLGARLNGIQEVVGSNPTSSTIIISVNKGGTTGILYSRPCGEAVSYTHLRAHETVLDLVCRLLLEKKNNNTQQDHICYMQTSSK